MTANIKESLFIKGELRVEEDLTIEGCVEGSIQLGDHNLWIAPHSKVNAEIHGKSVIIAGDVIGNIFASEMVEIRLSGSVLGNIECPRISVVDGAKFTGRMDTERTANATTRLDFPKTQSAKIGHGP